MLGWQDLRHRYRRSLLGPFWITVSMGIVIATIGVVFGPLLQVPMKDYLPYIAAGMIVWNFVSSMVTESCLAFTASEALIKQSPVPVFVHFQRVVWRNVLILAHNFLIFPAVLLAVGRGENANILCVVPGFLLLLANVTWAGLILAVLSTRYRDLPQMVSSALSVLFYVTPILWMASMLTERPGARLLFINPLYHLVELVRAPLLGLLPAAYTWSACAIMAVSGWALALCVYGRARRRIVFWL